MFDYSWFIMHALLPITVDNDLCRWRPLNVASKLVRSDLTLLKLVHKQVHYE